MKSETLRNYGVISVNLTLKHMALYGILECKFDKAFHTGAGPSRSVVLLGLGNTNRGGDAKDRDIVIVGCRVKFI